MRRAQGRFRNGCHIKSLKKGNIAHICGIFWVEWYEDANIGGDVVRKYLAFYHRCALY
jgi:hypothetical protein